MRRLLAMIALFVLPMQWGFAAVAEYCQHEVAPAAQVHLGHHGGSPVTKAADGGKDKSGERGELDCPTCHQLCATALVVDVSSAAVDVADCPQFALLQSFPQRPPENPFRPPRLVAGA